MDALSWPAPAEHNAKAVPLYLYVTVLASLSIMVGLIWDISWHISIGRDGLFSAPHLAIYLGGVVAGLFSGYRVLALTFKAGAGRERSVKFWGIFYGSLGNLFCIWGALAMLTSAPFDDWWHNTYGLDVTILSPPHTVLLLGMITIQLGAIVSVVAYQNLDAAELTPNVQRRFTLLQALSSGFILAMIYTMASEYLGRHEMHNVVFYEVASGLFPLLLVSFSVSSRSRWGATQASAVYSVLLMLMVWILPLFPATPRLGPVLNPITSFQPFDFPLLILLPAVAIDLVVHRSPWSHRWVQAVVCGAVFLFVFILFQWPFATLLMASHGHWFFGTSKWYFGADPNWEYRYFFRPHMVSSGLELVKGIAIAFVLAVLSSRAGLGWGGWLKRIVR
ncbi:hypothetical protein [Chryseolinea lacunae]|uniref:Uncharacterized protein n=1 Tax=Chryseolinea lacunae TaxID=2801331 RepID=A0ABS1KZ37_9BACT|nr:hypothetical protein [Chryseolinea lacunae]MBL0744720.1 hypothetical protein [Chryseolinea lacunae]